MPIQIDPTDGELAYFSALRNQSYDAVVADVHIGAWLLKSGTVAAIAMEQSNHAYFVVVDRANESIYQLDDLAGRKICSPTLPDIFLSHLLLEIDNPHREPIVVAARSAGERLRYLQTNRCIAMIVHMSDYHDLSDRQRRNLRILFQSDELPGRSFLLRRGQKPLLDASLELWFTGSNTNQYLNWLALHPTSRGNQWGRIPDSGLGNYLYLTNDSLLPELFD